jgi:exoribonuclease R
MLAKQLRQKRFGQGGALSIDNIQLNVLLDEKGSPKFCLPYVTQDSNKLVEEVRE